MVEDYYEYNLKKYFLGLYMFAVTTHDLQLQACWAHFGAYEEVGDAEHRLPIPLPLLISLR